jgi:hypothetical protein
MMSGGSLVPVFGWLVGTGPGAGIAVLFVVMGVFGSITSLAGYSIRSIRDLETLIPDYDAPSGQAAPS